MMYHEKLAVAIKSAGKVLREFNKDQVYIPFGSEYSVLIKNLNTVRVQVKVWVDGMDATEGTWLVINPREELVLERFIKGGNLSAGNRFKFIERTEKIEEGPRGIRIDDGLVRIEYQFEQSIMWNQLGGLTGVPHHYRHSNPWYGDPNVKANSGILRSSSLGIVNTSASTGDAAAYMNCSNNFGSASASVNSVYTDTTMSVSHNAVTEPVNDVGITVPGSVSNQKFTLTQAFAVESTTHTIILHLLGKTKDKIVQKPVTVKAKQRCVTCGRLNKATAHFCAECGTGLELVV